jgi:glycine/D-amino acid oxidase-like deaminating enzyme
MTPAPSPLAPPHSSLAPNPRLTRRRALAALAAPVLFSATKSAAAKDDPSDSFDAVVIGAGSIGCNTAWHLRERGQRVVILEAQEAPASQSTGGAAGFVACWSVIHIGNWKKTEWEMQRYGIDFYTRLSKRTAADFGFSPCGITYIYLTPDGWQRTQKKIEAARKLGTQLEVLTAERAKEVAPFLQFDKVAGIVFDPDAIRVRAGDAITALAKELANQGVEFRYSTPVTGFVHDEGRIVGVRVGDREIKSNKVIVAAGAWSRPLLANLGVNCPARPFNETRYVTNPLPGLKPDMPLLIFSDRHGHYIREEKGGLLIGGGDDRPLPKDREVDADNPPWCNKLPSDQAYRVKKYVDEITPVMPVLAKAEIATIRSGLPTTTADRNFIAGPVPGLAGLFVMSGCQEAGVTHGPALGRILTEYALDGKTNWDTSAFSLTRFKA